MMTHHPFRSAWRGGLPLLLALLAQTPRLDAQPLRQLLASYGLRPPADLENADELVTSHALLQEPNRTVLTYLMGPRPRIGVVVSEAGGRWRHRSALLEPLEPRGLYINSLTDLRAAGGYLYARGHINPSATLTFFVNDSLQFRGALAGWVLAGFSDGSVFYHRNQVHFAAVHALELRWFDPATRDTTRIYPLRTHGAVRTAHRDRVAEAYRVRGEDWFRENNHPMDPDNFPTALLGDVVVDEAQRAAAFLVSFDNRETFNDRQRAMTVGFPGLSRVTDMTVDSAAVMVLSDIFTLDLTIIRNIGLEAATLRWFEADPDLHDLLAVVLLTPRRPQGMRNADYLRAIDPRWSMPETWGPLVESVRVPPLETRVLVLCRGIVRGAVPDCRELALDDVKQRFGVSTPADALRADVLRRIFDGG